MSGRAPFQNFAVFNHLLVIKNDIFVTEILDSIMRRDTEQQKPHIKSNIYSASPEKLSMVSKTMLIGGGPTLKAKGKRRHQKSDL